MKAPMPVLIAAASMALSTPALCAQVSGPNAEVQATVDAALRAGVAGDAKTLLDQYAPDCTFVDEYAPFIWTGPGAIQSYLMSGFRMYQETQHKDRKTRFSPPSFVYVSSDRAFVVESLSGTATVKGRPYAVKGAFAFTLARIDGRWKITSQTWTKARENMDPYL